MKPEPPGQHPLGAQVVLKGDEVHRPKNRVELGSKCLSFVFPLSAALRFQGVSAFPIDRDGGTFDPGLALLPRLRVGAIFDTGRAIAPFAVRVEYEHDVFTGTARADDARAGYGYPDPPDFEHQLRKANVRLSYGNAVHLTAGWNTSHWGMGLVANDGAHGWTPGSAQFLDPRGGDRVLRAQLATGPLGDVGFVAAAGADLLDGELLTGDDILYPGDDAAQIVGAVAIGQGKPHGAGFYFVLRHQEAADGRATDVRAFDLTARTKLPVGRATLALEAEGALVTGETELAPSTVFPEHDVLQGGMAFRASLDAGWFGSVLDVLYASGDQNLDDASQNAFKVDPNFQTGLVLFEQVLAAQSARGVATAGDTTLVGVPAQHLERIATRGSVTNTVSVFPKLRARPLDGLEFYTGLLFAWAAVPIADPFNTRIGGGTPRNATNGLGGRYLGTELDIGARYRLNAAGFEATIGAEFGTLRPGTALVLANRIGMDAVHLGRLTLDARL